MGKKNQKKPDLSIIMIFVIIIVVLLIVIAISNMISGSKKVNYKANLPANVTIDTGKDANIVINEMNSEQERLEKMTERARIEYYVTKFIDYVEAENYDEAYDLLNDDYKKNYFQTQTKFEEYAKSHFSKMMNIEFNNFERSGDVYVIWMTVVDAINGSPDTAKEINFVVKEHNYNDFELSFSAN